jgi:hypothetical protein
MDLVETVVRDPAWCVPAASALNGLQKQYQLSNMDDTKNKKSEIKAEKGKAAPLDSF